VLYSFGSNLYGQLGIGNYIDTCIPERVFLKQNIIIEKVFTSSNSSFCFLKTKNLKKKKTSFYCFGANDARTNISYCVRSL